MRQVFANDFDRALHVALDDDVEVLDARHLDLLGQAFKRDAAGFRQLCLAFLELAVLRNALGLVAVSHHDERVAGIRHAFQTQDFYRG